MPVGQKRLEGHPAGCRDSGSTSRTDPTLRIFLSPARSLAMRGARPSLSSEEGQSSLLGLYLGSNAGQEELGHWIALCACDPDLWELVDRGPQGRSVGLPVLGCNLLLLPHPEPSEPQVGYYVWKPGVCGVFSGFVPSRKCGPKGGSSGPKEGSAWISASLRTVTSVL